MKRFKRRLPLYTSLIAIVVAIAIYLIFCSNGNVEISTLIGTALAIIGGVAFWLEFYHNNKINEASFIMELNDQFISDPNMTSVEHRLEQYYDLVKTGAEKEKIDDFLQKMEEDYDISKPERQYLVNYLVHLEAIATLVNTGVLRLKTINDLMAYRYFIAVNNSVVQELELKPYKEYYKGCFEIFHEWEKYIKSMPLKDSPLIERVQK